MSNNDSIKRGVLKKQVLEYVRTHIVPTVNGVLTLIGDAPAVPHEMTVREFVRAKNRMCVVYRRNDRETGCWECPLYDLCDEYNDDEDIARQNADKAVSIVEKWAREHPEERSES